MCISGGTSTCAYQGARNIVFFGKFCLYTKWMDPELTVWLEMTSGYVFSINLINMVFISGEQLQTRL